MRYAAEGWGRELVKERPGSPSEGKEERSPSPAGQDREIPARGFFVRKRGRGIGREQIRQQRRGKRNSLSFRLLEGGKKNSSRGKATKRRRPEGDQRATVVRRSNRGRGKTMSSPEERKDLT